MTHAGVNGGCETFRVRGEHLFSSNNRIDHYLLGAEGRGVVVAVGASDTTSVAHRPTPALGEMVTFGGGGAFSEYAIVPAARCFTPPQGVPGPQAVALALSGTVAYTALHAVADVTAGETVLVTAAAGGTGHFAVQAAQLAGARVVATCGGGRKAARLRALGVDRIIDYTTEVGSLCLCTLCWMCVWQPIPSDTCKSEGHAVAAITHVTQDVGAVLREEYPQGIDLVYEGVGGTLFATAMANLQPRGRVLVLGYISQYPHNGVLMTASTDNATGVIDASQQGHSRQRLRCRACRRWRSCFGSSVRCGGGSSACTARWYLVIRQ